MKYFKLQSVRKTVRNFVPKTVTKSVPKKCSNLDTPKLTQINKPIDSKDADCKFRNMSAPALLF